MDDAVRWNVKVSRNADRSVRGYLAQRGMKKGDLSKFVEEAVQWRVFRLVVEEARDRVGPIEPAELDKLIAEAVSAARTEKSSERHG